MALMKRFGVGLLAVGCVLGGSGCDKLIEAGIIKTKDSEGEVVEAKAVAAKTPLGVSWNERTGTVAGGSESIEVLALKADYTITLKSFAKGTKYEVAGKQGTVNSYVYEMVNVDVRNRIGGLSLDELRSVDFGLTMTLDLPDGRSGQVKLAPVYVDYGLREVLRTAENGPVSFGAEPDDPTKDNCLIWPTSSELEKYSVCTKVQDVDWVAVEHELPEEKSTKICKGYKDKDGKPTSDITLVSKDTEMTIYDRRTGKVIDKKTFPPDADFPMFAMTSSNDAGRATAYPDREAMQTWLRHKPKR